MCTISSLIVLSNVGRLDIARRLYHDLFDKGLLSSARTYELMCLGFINQDLHKDTSQFLYKERDYFPLDYYYNYDTSDDEGFLT